jgi:hypothetical protein
MRVHTWLDRREVWVALLFLAALTAGCGAANNNPALERAREAYQKARQDPEVAGRAAVALDKAGQTLQQAERVWKEDNDVTEVEHLAYVAEKRVEIARATARRRLAADEIQKLKFRRD